MKNDDFKYLYNYTKKIYLFPLLICVLIIIIVLKRITYYDYYLNNGTIVDDYILQLYVNKNDLDIIQDNNKIQIKNKLFAYTIESISEPVFNIDYYYKVNIFVELNSNLNKKNNLIKFKILKRKMTILEYIKYKIGGK